jgi:L-rhamnose-H+ transport protein
MSLGILLVLVGGIMEGTYALAMKFTPKWKWEHIWGAGSLAALVLVPWPLALLTIPRLWNAFGQVGVADLVWPTLFGLGFGAGSIFFGLGVDAVGIGVGISIILGLVSVVGSLVPLLISHPDKLAETSGRVLMTALLVMIVGIVLCGLAGSWRDKEQAARATAEPMGKREKRSFGVGLLFCILSGVLSPFVNFALIQGEHLRSAAIANGASPGNAINAVWALVFTSCYGLNVAFCLLLMAKNKNLKSFVRAPAASYWLLAAAMGALWAGGISVYGVGVTYLGTFGAYAGWCLLLIASIAAGNVGGILVGEWKGSSRRSFLTMMGGMAVLALAAIILGYANRLLGS